MKNIRHDKAELNQAIAADIAKFLAAGQTIDVAPAGASAEAHLNLRELRQREYRAARAASKRGAA